MFGPSRPRSILGLSARLLWLRRRQGCGCGGLVVVAILVVVALLGAARCSHRRLRVATFNIENFPRNSRQIRGAFRTIEELDAPVIAVQEITDPAAFRAAARRELGDGWRAVFSDGDHVQHLGVLYDGDRFDLAYRRTHDETQIGGRHKPVLEVRLRRRGGGRAVTLFVVHLKSGGDNAAVRREQLRQLTPRIADAADSWDEVLVLGDFNATGDEDRESLQRFAHATGMTWVSEPLPCTAYWNRRDGCRGSALDHVMSRRPPSDIAARGPCESEGCAPRDRCPAFHREVSDHCPVTVDF